MNTKVIEAIVTIANDNKIIAKLEPNTPLPQTIQSWMVKRVLYSFLLFSDEVIKDGNSESTRNPK